jgi:hypothetical protein
MGRLFEKLEPQLVLPTTLKMPEVAPVPKVIVIVFPEGEREAVPV